SPVIKDYILSDKFEENIKLICKIEKLEDEKSAIIIENVAVSVLIGVLPITEAKETLIESFKSSGILLEAFSAGLILKNIDAYILRDIRKQILESKIENQKEIRHLTLKENSLEREKEELRKILLERTGNISGKGEPLFQYQKREIKVDPDTKLASREQGQEKVELNRDSLLAKIHLQNISDTDKIKERMLQIKKEEEERLEKMTVKEREEREEREKRSKTEQDYEEGVSEDGILIEEKNENVSKAFAEILKEKLESHADQDVDLEALKKERAEEEKQNEIQDIYTSSGEDNASTGSKQSISKSEDLNPYRENF
ncbi:MAG: hypothetical protein RI945_384, partial [Candidatus Parcubacteria bacterium]